MNDTLKIAAALLAKIAALLLAAAYAALASVNTAQTADTFNEPWYEVVKIADLYLAQT